MVESSRISLDRLTWLVARDVNRTLGGGFASMELLRRTFTANGALEDTSSAGLVAVSRLTPGTNVLAYCVALGWLLQRWAGAVAAVLAASVPASVLIFALTAMVVELQRYRVVRALLAIGVVAATILVLSSAWFLLRPYMRRVSVARSAVVAGVAAATLAAGATPVRVLLVCAVLGALLGVPASRAELNE